MEQTLILLKPDTVHRGLVGQVISRIEDKGFQIVALKLLHMDRARAENLYAPHVGKPFFEPVVGYMTSGPIVALVVGGKDAIASMRLLMGATDPRKADPGSIRGRFGQTIERNCIHGSDSEESATREIPIFFSTADLVAYKASFTEWV